MEDRIERRRVLGGPTMDDVALSPRELGGAASPPNANSWPRAGW
ncbi:hypothetical protein ABGB14_05530 [Nonomuraea sp. B10E15]